MGLALRAAVMCSGSDRWSQHYVRWSHTVEVLIDSGTVNFVAVFRGRSQDRSTTSQVVPTRIGSLRRIIIDERRRIRGSVVRHPVQSRDCNCISAAAAAISSECYYRSTEKLTVKPIFFDHTVRIISFHFSCVHLD